MTLHEALRRIAAQRVFFGHQSVGDDLLAGVRELAAIEGVALPIREVGPREALRPGLSHARVPENGDPYRKLASFERALEGRSPDLALVKFCYVDIRGDTDTAALFTRYRETVARLRNLHPATTFVHATAPLTTVQSGLKGLAKRLLGRSPWGTIENVRREQYNALVRKAYAGREPLFDLAAIESTEDGQAVSVLWEGQRAPAMARVYTHDGGHLNELGRSRGARELAAVLGAARA
jgi:hypothetical protein